MNKTLRAVEITHLLLGQLISPGAIVMDATAGNGYDTLFLAQKVGSTGKVYAFDIQRQAIEKTRELLTKHACLDQVELICDSHEHLTKYLPTPLNGAIFNLGYLPGGDKKIITSASVTVLALFNCMELLAPGGVIAVVVYPGHTGGDMEAIEIEKMLTNLPSASWYVFDWRRVNASKKAPYLLLVQKQ